MLSRSDRVARDISQVEAGHRYRTTIETVKPGLFVTIHDDKGIYRRADRNLKLSGTICYIAVSFTVKTRIFAIYRQIELDLIVRVLLRIGGCGRASV
jgi:hypothetical protein